MDKKSNFLDSKTSLSTRMKHTYASSFTSLPFITDVLKVRGKKSTIKTFHVNTRFFLLKKKQFGV